LIRGELRVSPGGSNSQTCPPLTFGLGKLGTPLRRMQAAILRERATTGDNGLPPSASQTFFGGGEAGPPATSVVVGGCALAEPDNPTTVAASRPRPARTTSAPIRGRVAARMMLW